MFDLSNYSYNISNNRLFTIGHQFLYELAILETLLYWWMVYERLQFLEFQRNQGFMCFIPYEEGWSFVFLGFLLLSCLSISFSKPTAWILKILGLASIFSVFPFVIFLLLFYIGNSTSAQFEIQPKERKTYLILIAILFFALKIDALFIYLL